MSAPCRARGRGKAALVALGAALCATAPLLAAEPSGPEKALAERLFQEARSLLDNKQHAAACPKFAESYRISGKLGTLLNLATCHEEEGKTASAWAEFTEAAAMAKSRGETERAAYADEHRQKLEARLSHVVIRLESAPPDARVAVDGHDVGRAAWGSPLPLDPGEHRIEVTAAGAQPFTEIFRLAAGPVTETIQVPPLTAGSASAEPSPTPDDAAAGDEGVDGLLVAGWVVLGIGIVGVGVGSYFGVRTFALQDDSDAHCEGTACDQEGVDLRSDASTHATVSTVAFAVGLAAAAGGLTMVLLSGPADDASASLDLAPWGSADAAGFTLRGIW